MSIVNFYLCYIQSGGDIMDIINQRIKDLREDLDLTQEQFAKIIQTTQRRISYIEKGITEPNIQDIRLIIEKFNINPYYLLNIKKPSE